MNLEKKYNTRVHCCHSYCVERRQNRQCLIIIMQNYESNVSINFLKYLIVKYVIKKSLTLMRTHCLLVNNKCRTMLSF